MSHNVNGIMTNPKGGQRPIAGAYHVRTHPLFVIVPNCAAWPFSPRFTPLSTQPEIGPKGIRFAPAGAFSPAMLSADW